MPFTAPVTRRRLLQVSGCAGALWAAAGLDTEAQAPPAEDLPAAVRALQPMTDGVSPIAVDEHRARLARAQKLIAEAGLDAIVVGPGSSLAYFTGAEWGLSERFLGMVLGRTGDPAWVTPAFEKDRALEQIRVGEDVRAWQEDESPYALVARALADRGFATGRVGIEETMPFAFSDGIGQALPAARLTSATAVTAGCRMVKDAHELALMRRACAVTLTAYRAVFASLSEGLTVAQSQPRERWLSKLQNPRGETIATSLWVTRSRRSLSPVTMTLHRPAIAVPRTTSSSGSRQT